MNKMLQIITVVIIIAAGIGGIISGAYFVLGTGLVVVGIVWQVFSHLTAERRNQFLEQVIEQHNRLLSLSGLGSPYTEIVKKEFKEKGKCRKAIIYLQKALDNNPDDLEALKYYISIMSLNFTMRQWTEHIKYGPKNKEWLYVYKLAERGYKKYPDNFVFPASLGVLLDLADDHKLARKMFRRSGQLRSDPYWHVHLAVSYAMSGRFDLAKNELDVAKNEGVHGWEIEYYYANLYMDLGDYDRALEHVRNAYKLGGKIPLIREIEAKCLFANGKLIAAGYSKVKLAWQILLLNPKRSFLLLFGAYGHLAIMIIIFLSKKIWPVTSHMPLFKNIQLKYFSPLEPEFTVGCSLVEKMHFKKAIELFNQCRKVNPRDVSVLMNLALCYARSGDREKAITTTKAALALEPDNNALKYNQDVFLSGIKLNGIVLVDKHGNFIKRIDAKHKP